MKKQFLLLGAILLFGFNALKAQDAPKRMTPDERTKATMEKLTEFKLDAAASQKTSTIFMDYYTAVQKAMEEMRASGNMDRDAMKASRQKLSDERDAKLKQVLTADQLKKWTDDIEPSLRPQRPPRN